MDVLARESDGLAPQARGLLLAVLPEACSEAAAADRIVAAARLAGVDPLDYCAHRFGLSDEVVMERAAHWAQFAFSPRVPRSARGLSHVARIDHLANIRTFRSALYDREVVFCAPRFEDLIRLAEARAHNGDLARRLCMVTARTLRGALARDNSIALLTEARQRLTRRWPYASADIDLPLAARIGFVVLFALTTAVAAVAPFFESELLLPFVAALLLLPALLRFSAVLIPPPRQRATPLLGDAALPIYTVLIPLRDEAGMVPMLRRAMGDLNYPGEKLDIKFVVEAKSDETVAAVEAILDDPRFELVVVPDAAPHTKPKALNYALPLARGEFIVVYDAEDIPDAGQLRLAASRFADDTELDCVQAELVVENADENLITALFAGEYAGQFGLMLPFLGRFRLPMPLGGTSNHFRTAALRELGHWDAFNVTEDADLGVRLSRLRYRTGVLDSETSEEAPIALGAWMVQRTRWIKGWMQTFIVHNRNARLFLGDIGWRNFIFFEIYVGGLILSSLLHTVFLIGLAARAATGYWPAVSTPVGFAYLAVFALGYGGSMALVLAGLVRRRAYRLIPQQLLLPLYWVLHSIAAIRATYQLLVRPYFWGKTVHGRTRRARQFAPQGDGVVVSSSVAVSAGGSGSGTNRRSRSLADARR